MTLFSALFNRQLKYDRNQFMVVYSSLEFDIKDNFLEFVSCLPEYTILSLTEPSTTIRSNEPFLSDSSQNIAMNDVCVPTALDFCNCIIQKL